MPTVATSESNAEKTVHINSEMPDGYWWMPFIWAGVVATCVVVLFWPTAQSIIRIWSVSDTFAHGFFVIPVFLWLVWRKRTVLAALPANPDLRPLIPIAISGALWLLSSLAGVQVAEHFAFSLILVFALWAVLGRHISRELMFPLTFLLFLAPVGEELVPVLMETTANMTVWAIRITGIPVYREGLFFSLPSGNWSVVEACSGIRYLIASSVLGSLYAYLTYTSLRIRILFIAISLITPIIANSMRAYLIVMLGHFSGNKLATGVDHIVYGWLFFGFVMFILFSIGSWLQRFDTRSNVKSVANKMTSRHKVSPVKRLGSTVASTIAILAVVASWPAWSTAINARTQLSNSFDFSEALLPQGQKAQAGLSVESRQTLWQPLNSGHDYRLDALVEHASLPDVRSIAFVYERQYQGKEMISSGNVLVKSKDDHWRLGQHNIRKVELSDGDHMSVAQSSLNAGNRRILVWQWYSVGHTVTSNAMHAKLLEVKDRLLLRKTRSVNYMLVVNEQTEGVDAALSSALNTIVFQ